MRRRILDVVREMSLTVVSVREMGVMAFLLSLSNLRCVANYRECTKIGFNNYQPL